MMEGYLEKLLSEPTPREWSFPKEEYDRRIARVRAEMEKAEADVLLVHSAVDLCYLTGYQTLWPDAYACFVLPLAGAPFMQVAAVEASCAVLHGDIEDLVLYDWVGSASAPRQLADVLRDRGYGAKRIAVQMGRIEMGSRGPVDALLMERLREGLPDAQFVDATYLMFDVRVTKSPAELEHMRESARITTLGMETGIGATAAGGNENEVAAIIAKVMIDAGSEFFSMDPIVNAGHRTGYFHTTFKRHPITAGDHVQIEIGGCYHRYTAPLMRTVILGEPGELVQRMIDGQLATLDLLYSNVRAGRTAHDVAIETNRGVAEMESSIFRSGHFGYSVGMGFPPTWTDGPNYIAEGNHRVLEAGMTFHTPFSWRVPKEFVVGTSESIAVTEDGCEILTEAERAVTLKGAKAAAE